MTRTEIREKITELLSDILDDEDLVLEDSTLASNVDGWDSVNHIKLIVAIEAEYGIRFDTEEATAPENVGALVNLIAKKIASPE